MVKRTRNKALLFAIPAVSVLASAVVFFGQSQADPPYLGRPEVFAAFHERTAQLALPPGIAWPKAEDVIVVNTAQPNYGKMIAETYWYCAWVTDWLADRPGSSERARAYLNIRAVRTMPLYRQYYNPQAQTVDDWEIAAAGRGDRKPLEHEIQLNCGPVVRVAPPATARR